MCDVLLMIRPSDMLADMLHAPCSSRAARLDRELVDGAVVARKLEGLTPCGSKHRRPDLSNRNWYAAYS